MATRSTTLFSLATLTAYCKTNGTSHDTIITTIGDGVSEKIDAYCGRPFVTRAITEVVDAEGRSYVRTKARPVQTVTEVKYRFSLSDAWTAVDESTEVTIDTPGGRIFLNTLAFPAGPLTTSVTYTAGFGAQGAATLPAAVVAAGLDFVKFCYDRWKSDTVLVASTSWGGMSLVPSLPKDVRDALDLWVLRRL